MHGWVEQQAIGALIRSARAGESGALVFEGDAGIGKTCICDYAAECAVGFTVVCARGIASEYGVPFSGLSQLLAPLVGDLPNLPDPQRDALATHPQQRNLRTASGCARRIVPVVHDKR